MIQSSLDIQTPIKELRFFIWIGLRTSRGTQNHQKPCFCDLKIKFFGGENRCFSIGLAGAPGWFKNHPGLPESSRDFLKVPLLVPKDFELAGIYFVF